MTQKESQKQILICDYAKMYYKISTWQDFTREVKTKNKLGKSCDPLF